jgi:hypothetical protein
MRMTTNKINYAVQRQNPELDEWDTIRSSITPLQARARRLCGARKVCARVFSFGLLNWKLRRQLYPSDRTSVFSLGRDHRVAQVSLTPFMVRVALRPFIQNSMSASA